MLPASLPPETAPLSAGEVNFLWWFIQGGLMDVETRHKLWDAWGMCPRHAAAWLTAEAAFRHGRLHGPAILYAELAATGLSALAPTGRFAGARARRALRPKAGCLVCESGFGPGSDGFVPGNRLQIGRDASSLARHLRATEPVWRGDVCGRCDGSRRSARCRPHLLEDLARDPLLALSPHRERLARLAVRLGRYERSFRWDDRGRETVEDRAALVSAVGWCGGWSALLAIIGGADNASVMHLPFT